MSMRNQNTTVRKTRPMMRWVLMLSALVCLASARPVHATYQIGQFFNDGGSGITWANNGNTGGQLSGTEGGYFTFTNLSGSLYDPTKNGVPIAATMTITVNTVTDGFTANNQLNQPLSGTLTVSIRDANNLNLLTATVTTGTSLLTGTGSAAAVVSATPRDDVKFTSDFFNASALDSQAFTVGLAAITPLLSFNTSGGHSFLNNFSAAPSGIFSANAVPVPEPASLALLGIGCVVLVGARRRFGRGVR